MRRPVWSTVQLKSSCIHVMQRSVVEYPGPGSHMRTSGKRRVAADAGAGRACYRLPTSSVSGWVYMKCMSDEYNKAKLRT
jgi:hypothetical protein